MQAVGGVSETWRDKWWLWLGLLTGAYFTSRSMASLAATGPTLCPVKRLTGMECPSCGSTRSASFLLQGDLAGAIRFNPMFVAMVLAISVFVLLRIRMHFRLNSSHLRSPLIAIDRIHQERSPLIALVVAIAGWTFFTNWT